MAKVKFGLSKKTYTRLEELSLGGKIYTAGSSFVGGWKRAYDNTHEYVQILNLIGVKYKIDNDAPRGGLNGKHIVCKKFDFERAKKILEIEVFRREVEE